jgi:hypothetical protein
MSKNAKTGKVTDKATATEKVSAQIAVAETSTIEAPAVPHINGEFPVGSKIETSLASPLEVFGKKDVVGKSASMKPCASIIFEKLATVTEHGENIIRVKKPNSTRIFYTTEGKLNFGEGAPVANLILPEPAEVAAPEASTAAE